MNQQEFNAEVHKRAHEIFDIMFSGENAAKSCGVIYTLTVMIFMSLPEEISVDLIDKHIELLNNLKKELQCLMKNPQK